MILDFEELVKKIVFLAEKEHFAENVDWIENEN
jgi:hypothetical protein